MEHLIQVSIAVDDERIEHQVEQYAVKKVTEDIKKQVMDSLFEKNYYNDKIIGLNEFGKKVVDNFLNEHKDLIIEQASDKLADRMSRMKVVREATEKTVEEIKDVPTF